MDSDELVAEAQRRIRDESHTRAHERIPDAILARESRAQDASTAVPVRPLLESIVCRFALGRRGALRRGGPYSGESTPSTSEQRQHPPPIELGLFHVQFPTPIAPSVAGDADETHNSNVVKLLS